MSSSASTATPATRPSTTHISLTTLIDLLSHLILLAKNAGPEAVQSLMDATQFEHEDHINARFLKDFVPIAKLTANITRRDGSQEVRDSSSSDRHDVKVTAAMDLISAFFFLVKRRDLERAQAVLADTGFWSNFKDELNVEDAIGWLRLDAGWRDY